VDVDNAKGVFLALDHLTALGHQRIACMNVGRMGDLSERLDAYSSYMQERFGRAAPEEYMPLTENSHSGGYEATRRLLSLPTPPTAVFAMDDVMAVGALGAAWDMGWAVPSDLSIVGFDDMAVSAYVRPALTSVRQPIEEIGRRAVDILLLMAQEDLSEPWPRVVLELELIVRDSSGPAPTE
jgi:DNA-binding LacI/PurR family transcriptional regulator